MLQGTGSDVGKSLLLAGLARAYTRRGVRVRPFKPQNMSNNAAVTPDGGEIGRAQALQALACGVPAHVDMNPVLLKPESERGAQIVVQGRVEGRADAREYARRKGELLPRVLESFGRLAAEADLVLVEGAGSASEINLRAGDIANMGFARAAGTPVVLVGDIDRGGVIASIVGTHVLLEPGDRRLLAGYLINKFRGDPALFEPAIGLIVERTGLPCFGVVPWFEGAHRLPAEDSMALTDRTRGQDAAARVTVVVPALPRIANFDDLDPLAAEPGVAVRFVRPGEAVPGEADLVVLPGSKSTLADLRALKAAGWDVDIRAHVRRGGRVIGLCAGWQMLGRAVHDPDGIEGTPGSEPGLGLIDVDTVIGRHKTLGLRRARFLPFDTPAEGYEMHMGTTTGPGLARPLLALDDGRSDGAISADGRVMGTYLHGLFASDALRHRMLSDLGAPPGSKTGYGALVEETLDALAAHLGSALDLDTLLAAARAPASP